MMIILYMALKCSLLGNKSYEIHISLLTPASVVLNGPQDAGHVDNEWILVLRVLGLGCALQMGQEGLGQHQRPNNVRVEGVRHLKKVKCTIRGLFDNGVEQTVPTCSGLTVVSLVRPGETPALFTRRPKPRSPIMG